jgi:hypothetical protein
MNMLTQLISMNPAIAEEHRRVINNALAEVGQIPDFTLTFGTFLPICQKLLEAKEKVGTNPAS